MTTNLTDVKPQSAKEDKDPHSAPANQGDELSFVLDCTKQNSGDHLIVIQCYS